MIKRILNWQIQIINFSVILLLLITAPEGMPTVNLLGGFSAINGMGRLNILAIMRWNLCVLPPIATSILFMSSELGPLSTYTVMRTTGVKSWYLIRLCAIVLANLIYIFTFILLGAALGINEKSDLPCLYRLMLVFPMHTILMSTISLTLIIILRSTKAAILAYLIVDGGLVILGSILPTVSKYLLPFWGMAQSDALMLQNSGYHLFITAGITVLLFCLFMFASIKWLQKNNPAADPLIT